MKGKIPDEIINRSKQAYRAPVLSSFLGKDAPGYLEDILSPSCIIEADIFNPASVEKLLLKMNSGKAYSEMDNMALTAVISTQLLYKQFIKDFKSLHRNELTHCAVRSEADYLN